MKPADNPTSYANYYPGYTWYGTLDTTTNYEGGVIQLKNTTCVGNQCPPGYPMGITITFTNPITGDITEINPDREVQILVSAPLSEGTSLPDNERYWKNIIPENYSIFKRNGIIEITEGTETTYQVGTNIINKNQNWLPYADEDNSITPYYPVLPKYSNGGRFVNNLYDDFKLQFPIDGPITNENYNDDSLKISIDSSMIENNVFNDNSGNNNYGFSFIDYKTEFTEET